MNSTSTSTSTSMTTVVAARGGYDEADVRQGQDIYKKSQFFRDVTTLANNVDLIRILKTYTDVECHVLIRAIMMYMTIKEEVNDHMVVIGILKAMMNDRNSRHWVLGIKSPQSLLE